MVIDETFGARRENYESKDFGEVDDYCLKQAERLLFDDELNDELHEKLKKLINKKFHRTGVEVLYEFNKDFKEFGVTNRLQYGKREVVIKPGDVIYYTEDYGRQPLGFEKPYGLHSAVTKIIEERNAKAAEAKKKAEKEAMNARVKNLLNPAVI